MHAGMHSFTMIGWPEAAGAQTKRLWTWQLFPIIRQVGTKRVSTIHQFSQGNLTSGSEKRSRVLQTLPAGET